MLWIRKTFFREGGQHMNNIQSIREFLRACSCGLLNDILRLFTPIPKAVCDCGKPVVFGNGKRRFICSRCGMAWELTVAVQKVKRTDWQQMIQEVNALNRRLQKKPRELKLGYQCSSGGILNAYREGNLTFRGAVAALKRWRKNQW
jgi:hypothetical protein